jgi:Raf kinase inhibitor-like YbhB/YbcL family protein
MKVPKLALTVEAFADGGAIPDRFTCEGENISPSLSWVGEPEGTQSFALILDDPDAPAGTWNHWLLWDIPRGVHALPEGYRPSHPVHSGTNDFRDVGYGGPCPPKRHGAHRYFFRLYALDTAALAVAAGCHRKELDRALRSHQLATAEYMGTFERS